MTPALTVNVFSALFALLRKRANGLENCIPPPGIFNTTTSKLDFPTCLNTVTAINISLADPAVAAAWSQSGCLNGDVSDAILSRSGCYIICGRGTIQLWPWKDTFDRMSLLVIPGLVLMAHLSFPPLPWQNYLYTIFRVVGNPVGSLESLLTRFEEHRRLRRAAKQILFVQNQHGDAEKVATIFAAFEEIGWQDVSEHFRQSYEAQPLDEEEVRIIRQASHELSTMRSVSIMSAFVAIVTLVGTLATAIIRTIKQYIQENARLSNEMSHTIAVVGLLFISIPQVWFSARLGNYTTLTGALHTINTMNKELRKASQRRSIQSQRRSRQLFPPLGFATCPLQPSPRGFCLYPCPLAPRSFEPELEIRDRNTIELPELQFTQNQDRDSQSLLIHEEEESKSDIEQFCKDWQNGARYLGTNGCWRPCTHKLKKQPSLSTSLTSPQNRTAKVICAIFRFSHNFIRCHHLQIISFVMITFSANLSAIFISATNHTNRRKIGLGCRSLTWVLIMSVWVLNYFQLDRVLRVDRFVRWLFRRQSLKVPEERIRRLWQYSLFKDGFITVAIILGVMLVEIGVYNTCWCRSSFTDMVNLNPYSPFQWAQAQKIWIGVPGGGLFIIVFLILWVELRGMIVNRSFHALEGGSPLCKTQKQMRDDAEELILQTLTRDTEAQS